MFIQPNIKVMLGRLPAGNPICSHQHATSCKTNYVLSGNGIAICDDVKERLPVGKCQFCPKGSSPSLINCGKTDLMLFSCSA